LLAGDENHVAADRLAERALGEELVGEVVEVRDLGIVLGGVLVDGEEALFGVEGEMPGVVVDEVVRAVTVTDDEELDEAEERAGVAVAGVVLVFDDLLDGPTGVDAERFQLDLDGRNAVYEQEDVVAVMAIVGVDSELADHFEGVFAPILDVHERVVQRSTVVAGEVFDAAEGLGGGENVGRNDLIEEALKLTVRELHMVEGLKLFAEVFLQRRAVADVRAMFVLQVAQFRDKL